jgi:hypothetical protein
VRAGFPCFGAAITGYVEATRDDDATKNRLCPPSPYGNTMADWALMNVLGFQATASFSSEPDIKEWADSVAVNPSGLTPADLASPAVVESAGRVMATAGPGVAALAALAGAAT